MATYDIDKLQIEIAVSSTNATKKIEELEKALAALEETVAGNTKTLKKVKESIDGTGDSAEDAAKKQDKMANSSAKLAIKVGVLYAALKKVSTVIAGWITESNEYIENLNLFTVAMGDATAEAKEYAETVQAALGIDPSEWMENQAMFKQVTSGFGVAEDAANAMSKQLTQLGYDISSLYNISIEDAMQKLQSGISGEIEPLRRLGFAIDNATLQQVAYNHGITALVSNMNQAQKSQLRYIAIMEQSTNAQGDLARTAQTPANAIRILKQQVTQLARACGNVLLPVLQEILPVAQAGVEMLTELVQKLAVFVGFELPTIDYSSLDGVTSGATDAEGALNDATDAANALKNATLSIDRLNVLNDSNSSGSNSSYSTNLGIDMSQWDYDFLGAVQEKSDALKETAKDILNFVKEIGLGLAAWKISSVVVSTIETLKSLVGTTSGSITIGIGLVVAGATMSYNAGYNIGYDGGSTSDLVKGLLGPVASMLGGAAIGNAIMPGIGAVAGGITGIVVGLALEVIGYIKGKKQGIMDRFYETELGQEILELQSRSQEIQIEFYAVTGEISTEQLANLTLARDLIDEIFTTYEQDNLTRQELQGIVEDIELFNSLGLGEIKYEFDGVKLEIQSTREELESLIDTMEEEMRLEALKEGYIAKYKLLAEQQAILLEYENALKQAEEERANNQNLLIQIDRQIDAYEDEIQALSRIFSTSGELSEAEQSRYAELMDLIPALYDEYDNLEDTINDNGVVIKELTAQIDAQKTATDEMSESFEAYAKLYKTKAGTLISANAGLAESYNKVATAAAGLAGQLSGLSTSGSISMQINTKAFASGGFPEHGEMFIANEAGPELVGRIGNRTAVANQDQIVSGIQRGVSDANAAQNRLLQEQNALLQKILAKTGTVLDGKTLSSSVNRANKERGVSIMSGGVM